MKIFKSIFVLIFAFCVSVNFLAPVSAAEIRTTVTEGDFPQPEPVLSLYEGWNLVAIPYVFRRPVTVGEFLDMVEKNYGHVISSIWSLSSSTWTAYKSLEKTIEPGDVFWIQCEYNFDLEIYRMFSVEGLEPRIRKEDRGVNLYKGCHSISLLHPKNVIHNIPDSIETLYSFDASIQEFVMLYFADAPLGDSEALRKLSIFAGLGVVNRDDSLYLDRALEEKPPAIPIPNSKN